MPTLDEINGVAVRTPIRMNLDAYAQALNKIDQRDLQARQLKSQITAGLSDLYDKLNVADHGYLSDYIDNINKQLDDAASYGNYSNALNTAISLAGEVANNPELHARIKANQDYETWKKEIQARADSNQIDQTTRDRILAQNPYEFDVETQQLKQYETPVNKLDMTNLFKNTAAFTLARTTGKDTVKYWDSNGNLTEEFSKDITGVGYQKFVQEQMRDKESLEQTFNTLLANDNTAYKALLQDYEDTKWELEQYDKKIAETDNPEEKARLESFRNEVAKKITYNGQLMTAPQYLFSRSQGVLENLTINDRSTQITPGTAFKPVLPQGWEQGLYDMAKMTYWNFDGSGNAGTVNYSNQPSIVDPNNFVITTSSLFPSRKGRGPLSIFVNPE